MSDHGRGRSVTRRDSRSPYRDDDRRNSRDRRDSRRRERSSEMEALMLRLRMLEEKVRASSASVCPNVQVVRSRNRDKSRDRSPPRRQRTSSRSRARLPSPARSTRTLVSPSRRKSRSRDRCVSPPRDRSQRHSQDWLISPTRGPSRLHYRSRSPPRDSERNSKNPRSTPERSSVTDRIVDAIRSINYAGRSSQHFYISNFDPNLHNFDDWCAEVDRAKSCNKWNDYECLSRIGNCLKGDARSWLNEWVSSDRSWTNFKKEFKPLCPKTPDIANILAEVINTNSDKYPTYADYARRALLRLRIVRGLSDELISAIIIRGISDPNIRASATNAKLMPNDLIEFFSIYVKPVSTSKSSAPRSVAFNSTQSKQTTDSSRKRSSADIKCFSCGQLGHRQANCSKRPRIDQGLSKVSSTSSAASSRPAFVQTRSEPCSFCKKLGHSVDTCFAKQRSEATNKETVNFCKVLVTSTNSDVVVAVIQDVPVDILIDSGSTISLMSSSLLKHFNCSVKPAFRILKGLGSQEVESTSYVRLPIEFDGLTLEVDLFIVPSQYMNTPVILGTDVLNREGVRYVRTKDYQRLTRVERSTDTVMAVQSEPSIPINTPLVDDQLQKLLEIVNHFSKFFISGTATSTVKTGCMSIKLNSNTPVYYRPYRLSHAETLRVREIIKDLLDKGIIEESDSEYASPILLVKKKDGSDRMCVDFRKLNEVTVKDRFPLPRIDDHIDRLGSNKFFSRLDMATGFHQIPLDQDSVPLTGFVTSEGHYNYLKMPYGLANAPVVYQRIIAKTLREFIESGDILVYIDDVLILSKTVDQGLVLLRKVLDTLTSAGFSINLKKCSFLATEIEYLGRTISEGQVRPSHEKVRALIDSAEPQNVKQVRQFLGLASYFRRYIANFAQKTACVAALTKKGVNFSWGVEQRAARKHIIECLTSEPVLAIYDPSLPIEVHTDASSIGYGAVLIQVHEGNRKRVVSYFSRLTQGAESKYHSYELETLAVVKALQHFRHYLVGVRFTVVTDCNALKLTQRKKDLLPRVARWWVYLQDFDFSLDYRKGSLLSHADYLSRNPVNTVTVQKPQNWARIAQASDEETLSLRQRLSDGQLDPTQYVVKNDILYFKFITTGENPKLLCYIPKGHRLSLMRIFHDEHDHPGVDKTVDLIMKHFWFPGLRAFALKYITHCLVCLSHKKVARAPLQPIHSWEKPDVPFETVHMDVLGPLPEADGYRYVLILIDAFSKYCLLYPMFRQESDELKRHVTNLISLFGTPKLIVADRGRMFQSADFLDWIHGMGCDTHLITPEMHQSNGQVERYCRTVLNMVRIECNYREQRWPTVMWKLQLVLNITKHRTTKCSALNLLIGIDAATPLIRSLIRDVAIEGSSPNREALREMSRQRVSERLRSNQASQNAYVNKGRKAPRGFELNSLVFVRKQAQATGKLDSCMRGPYRVMKILPHCRYELQLLAGSYGKLTQAAAEYMMPWHGEWTPDVCSAFFSGE